MYYYVPKHVLASAVPDSRATLSTRLPAPLPPPEQGPARVAVPCGATGVEDEAASQASFTFFFRNPASYIFRNIWYLFRLLLFFMSFRILG